jgi:hypothetical protein
LHAIGQSTAQIRNERNSGRRIASTEQLTNKHLRIGTDRGPGPSVASVGWCGLGFLYVVILGVNEAPDFIHLDPLARLVAQRPVLIGSTGVASINQKLCYCIFASSG